NNLVKAKYEVDPREDGSLSGYTVVSVPISTLTLEAVKDTGISHKLAGRSKNMFALGIVFWLYDRPLEHAERAIERQFGKKSPEIAEANKRALLAGYNFAETAELFSGRVRVGRARLAPGNYRMVTGNQATALGIVAAASIAKKELVYASYPITPASDILHELSRHKNFGVKTFQAEDEIAAMGAAIGAAFGGAIGVTGTSGPGLALKSEAIGLAVMTELPVVIVDVQRGGPSTGLPTKTAQADLLQAYFGRNGECPVCIVAPATPVECFQYAIEAVRIATRFMVPVIFLSDGYLANGAEPWNLPRVADLPSIDIEHRTDPENFLPYARDPRTLARPWVVPGTPGLEHRIGGLEKEDLTGNVSYDPENHERMVRLRADKVDRIADHIPDQQLDSGPEQGDLLVLGWGSTYGAIKTAAATLRSRGHSVAHAHLRYLRPFPKNLGSLIRGYKQVLIPELNHGQLIRIIRDQFLVDAKGYHKIKGIPLTQGELVDAMEVMLGSRP